MSLEIQPDSFNYDYGNDSNNGSNNNNDDPHDQQSSSSSSTTTTTATTKATTTTTTATTKAYIDHSTNDLSIATGAALIVADCMGTGILALPNDINSTLGKKFGLFFLFINIVINLYAGTILCNVALLVEKRFCGLYTSIMDDNDNDDDNDNGGHDDDNDDGHNENKSTHQNVSKARSRGDNDINEDTNALTDGDGDWNYNNYENDNDNIIIHTNSSNGSTDMNIEVKGDQSQQELYQTASTSISAAVNYTNDDEYDTMEQLNNPISTTRTANENKTTQQQEQDKHDHGHGHDHNHGAHTFDFIGITSALFDQAQGSNNEHEKHLQSKSSNTSLNNKNTSIQQKTTTINTNTKPIISKATILVTITYYTNIFLVLGNYILVMSHAVAAMIGENNICLPNAGLIASTLMFGLCQLRSMSSLGRIVSFISLFALAVVVVQCLVSIQLGNDAFMYVDDQEVDSGNSGGGGERLLLSLSSSSQRQLDQQQEETEALVGEAMTKGYTMIMIQSMVRQLAALSSIGFAVGSQKLLLNIRHEFKDRTQAAPQSLGISLGAFGSVYALVCIMSGPKPPSFLFDAISPGNGRRIAGFLLWIHVAVSFAINSQALCSSIDRIRFHHITLFSLHKHHRLRWAILTFFVSIISFLIANAVPFFKDLVSLIGALTSIPLTLLLPAIYHRKIRGLPVCCWSMNASFRQQEDIWSFLLVVFSIIFLICGVIGSLSSIEIDWSHHGPPFACH